MIAQFIMGRAEARRRRARTEAAQGIVTLLDAAVILFQPMVHIATAAVDYCRAEHFPDGTRIGVVPIRRALLWRVPPSWTRLR